MVPSAPKPHAPPSVTRASPSSIAFGGVARSARTASASSAVEATAPRPTRRQRAFALASPRRLRARVAPGLVHERALAAAAREGVSERRPPVRDQGRFRASAQPPPLLRVAKRHRRDVAAEERRALETRRRASSCHREPGGVCSHAAPFHDGWRWWLSEREDASRSGVMVFELMRSDLNTSL